MLLNLWMNCVGKHVEKYRWRRFLWQVANYGIGGRYTPHTDHGVLSMPGREPSEFDRHRGDRIATFMTYVRSSFFRRKILMNKETFWLIYCTFCVVGWRWSGWGDGFPSRGSLRLAQKGNGRLLVESHVGFERWHFDTSRWMSRPLRFKMEYYFTQPWIDNKTSYTMSFVLFLWFLWSVCNKWFHSGEQFLKRPCESKPRSRITYPAETTFTWSFLHT